MYYTVVLFKAVMQFRNKDADLSMVQHCSTIEGCGTNQSKYGIL